LTSAAVSVGLDGGGQLELVVGALALGMGMLQARNAATVAGSCRMRTNSAAPARASVLVGVGRPAFWRQVAMSLSRDASTLGSAGVPVTETEGSVVAETVGLEDDVDVEPSDEALEQALSAGTASAATAATGTSVRKGTTVPPRLG
jgi:hypothetical protein